MIVQAQSTENTPLRRSRKGRRFLYKGHKQGGDAH
nr:MAG TPA: hypothetical protein [Caudoviricetes sp.]